MNEDEVQSQRHHHQQHHHQQQQHHMPSHSNENMHYSAQQSWYNPTNLPPKVLVFFFSITL